MLSYSSSRKDASMSALTLFIWIISALGILAKNKPHTVLARQLLRGYENLPPPKGPTTVRLGIYINYFYGMSEQSMDYRLSFYMRQQWHDSRFAFDSKKNQNITKLKLEDSQFQNLWVPDVYFRNEKGAGFHSVTQNNRLVYINDTGHIWYVSKITATFSCPMRLRKYPMDKQSCPIRFESFGYTTDTIIFKWINDPIEFDPKGKELPEMEIIDHELRVCTHNDTSDFQPGEYPCLEIRFIATRPLGYFLIQFYVPSSLLVILSWVGFWISADAVVARVSIGLLTVLNLVTQSTGSRNQLPKVSYIKAIDVWMTASLFFAFASLIEFAVVNVWSRTEARKTKQGTSGTAAPDKDPATRTVAQRKYPAAETAAQRNNDKEITRQQVTLQVSDRSPGVSRARRLSDLSNIVNQPLMSIHQLRAQTLDQLSRKLFPCTFLVFNVIYWVAYSNLAD